MISGYADLRAGLAFLVVVSIISLSYIGRKIIEKQGYCRSECGSEKKEEVAERKPVEGEAGPSAITAEEGCFDFNVFISFRGKDTRDGFTSHLYKELAETRGITTFIDCVDLEKGEKINNLLKDIERSKVFVPVFSKNYAESKWCLREIAKMVEIHKKEGAKRPIIPIFHHVEPSDVEHCRKPFGQAFQKYYKEKLSEGLINEWKAALAEAGNISGFCLSDGKENEAKLITLIGKAISKKLCKTTFDIQLVIGIGPRIGYLKQLLEREKEGVCMIGICGLGGIGKTTLAMTLYNELSPTFDGSCFLPNIGSKRENGKEYLPTLQAELLKQILGRDMKIVNFEQGVGLIKERLCRKKILLILDDVDDEEQLKAFTANRKKKEQWFGVGSKIIVTTRDKGVLRLHGLQEDNDIYFPEGLNREDSLQLFCHHAFVGDQPLVGFKELSLKVVEVAKGLPLALTVFGSLFYDLQEKQDWEEQLKKLESYQNKKVHERLKISYDGLDADEKRVFLDIACFFIGTEKEYPVYMWKACGYFPGLILKVLQHKSLIKINKDDQFEMHDQIRDMGRMIVKEEGNSDPPKYSRPWSRDQLSEVLRDAKVSLRNPYLHGIQFDGMLSGKIEMSWKSIAAMSSLRMITGAYSDHSIKDPEKIIHLPSNIRWFQWFNCPYKTLAFYNDHHEKLCVLDLQGGCFRDFRSHSMVFPNLKVLDLTYCDHLIRTPDFTHLPSLEKLLLDECAVLTEIDESIGHLEKLVKLSMMGCEELKGLPAGLWKLTSLESLDLSACEQISVLPTQIGNLRSLKRLYLRDTSISALSDSIGSLQSLEALILEESEGVSVLPKQIGDLTSLKYLNLKKTSISALPDSIGNLESLKMLDLTGCTRISVLPKQIGGLTSLTELTLGDTSVSSLPDSIGSLESLETLNCEQCRSISILPKEIGGLTSLKYLELSMTPISALPDSIESLRSLEKLHLGGCTTISILPKQIGDLTSLEYLYLNRTSIADLPDSIGRLQSLKKLDLQKCKGISILPKQIGDLRSLKYLRLSGTSISALPDSIGSLQCLKDLYLSGCFSLEKLPDSICQLKSLSSLSLYGCEKLEQLPNSVGMLTSLKELDICHCRSLREVPDSLGDLNNDFQISLEGCISLEKLSNSIRISAGYSFEFDGCKSLRRLPDSLGDGMSTVCKLSFSGCESLEEIPESLGMRLKYLEDLDLSGCTLLTKIPESIGKLKSLKRLILKHCQSLEELPAECISTLSLEELDLSGCTLLTRIPESIGQLKSLKRLILKHCQSLAELPAECSNMLSLEELDLSGCISIKNIPKSIGDLKLRHLSLEDCRSLKELPESMESLESLEVLHIGGGMSVKKVPDFIRKLTNLQTLYLREIDDIPDSFGMIKSLKELHLSASFRTIPESMRELNCLKGLILMNPGCLSRDLMEKLSQASFKKLERLLILGASDGSDLLFGLPKSKAGHVVKLQGRCYLAEKLPSSTSDINIRIQVVVQEKIVSDVTCTAKREGEDDDSDDDGAEELEKLGLGGQVFYKIDSEEGYKILRCVKEGNPTWISESEEEEQEEEEEGEMVSIGGWCMLRVPTNCSYGRLRMAFFQVTYSDNGYDEST